ncbi:hypothetical protein FOXYSP1_11512 [Fusarium oxysporum f. sp. phaseoli]
MVINPGRNGLARSTGAVREVAGQDTVCSRERCQNCQQWRAAGDGIYRRYWRFSLMPTRRLS